MTLPRSFLRARWVKPSPAILSALEGYNPGPWGKVQKIKGNLVALDAAYNRDGSIHSIKVARLTDHPALAQFPPGTPRATRSIYRKEKRLAMAMATDAWWVGREIQQALEAWGKWRAAMGD